YIVHRYVLIKFLDKGLGQQRDGKFNLEEYIHKLVFPMGVTSDEQVNGIDHNLWIIDERLSYHSYLASDKQLRKHDVLESQTLDEPDIAVYKNFFKNASAYAEGTQPFRTIVVVEFKRPGRTDYYKKRKTKDGQAIEIEDDPIQQVIDYVDAIRKGTIYNESKQRPIYKGQDKIPAFAYIICDISDKIRDIVDNFGHLKPMVEGSNQGYFGNHPTKDIYFEIVSYDLLLQRAKERNNILFEKLDLPKLDN
ncbi:MAG TPA: hypothetical protein V6C96_01615, partial [Vampirovibrionales bacterium]